MKTKQKVFLATSIGLIALGTIAGLTTVMVLRKKKQDRQNIENKQNEIKETEKENQENKSKETEEEKEIKETEAESIFTSDKKEEINSNLVFPTLNQADYYDHLNFRNNQAWIDEEMIKFIVDDILAKILVENGVIKYNIEVINDQNVLLNFIWANNSQKAFRTYKISTNVL
ncbi:ATP synthase E subunit [Metamycoplasma subdolum]|uniref:ATP synthase E subunit n=1 Tax=Metamycoplasma subdolum TaxID=92407 RepID=A0A3M0A4Y4_9BACT|nr:hypothetical protein [Metamycoplasma subdolum]RMA78559.1 ATP synthase E subunit [Metamycoplasma subdolum]WPB50302.1 hypothetical protein R9C05_01675 [Metamycoplasma subdolum]